MLFQAVRILCHWVLGTMEISNFVAEPATFGSTLFLKVSHLTRNYYLSTSASSWVDHISYMSLSKFY